MKRSGCEDIGHVIKMSRRKAKRCFLGSSSTVMEGQSSILTVGTGTSGSWLSRKSSSRLLPLLPALVLWRCQSLHASNQNACTLDAIEYPQATLVSNVTAQDAIETHESHPVVSVGIDPSSDVLLSDVFEEIALDYGDSVREESARLSCEDDELWDPLLETPPSLTLMSLLISLPMN